MFKAYRNIKEVITIQDHQDYVWPWRKSLWPLTSLWPRQGVSVWVGVGWAECQEESGTRAPLWFTGLWQCHHGNIAESRLRRLERSLDWTVKIKTRTAVDVKLKSKTKDYCMNIVFFFVCFLRKYFLLILNVKYVGQFSPLKNVFYFEISRNYSEVKCWHLTPKHELYWFN